MRNKAILQLTCVLLFVFIPAGCSGRYILTVPDQVAPAGGLAAVAVRLQQYEFASLKRSIEDAPIRFRIDKGLERGAFTDELGFAGTTVPVPEKAGKYSLQVAMQNSDGDEVSVSAPAYVWKKDSPVIIVDLDCLPNSPEKKVAVVRNALKTLSTNAHIIYLTQSGIDEKTMLRKRIRKCGYPDGPILIWLQRYHHFTRMGRLRFPQIVTEAHLVSRLKYLREMFPNLSQGVCDSYRSARAFCRVGIHPIIIGNAKIENPTITRYKTWAELLTDN